MTVKEKYLELCKKSVNRKNNGYLFTYLENRPKSCLRTLHCLKVEIINCHKMCRIFHETLQYAWEPRNGDCGRLGNLYAILLENNISMMSQLSLNLGIFWTVKLRFHACFVSVYCVLTSPPLLWNALLFQFAYSVCNNIIFSAFWWNVFDVLFITLWGLVPESVISANPGLKFCSTFCIYLPMQCLE